MLPKEKATSSVLGTIVESEEEARNGEQSSFLIQFCQTLHVIMSHCSFTTLWSWFLLFCLPLCYLYMVWFWAPAAGNEQKESLRMVLLYVVVKRGKFCYQFTRVYKTFLKIRHCYQVLVQS